MIACPCTAASDQPLGGLATGGAEVIAEAVCPPLWEELIPASDRSLCVPWGWGVLVLFLVPSGRPRRLGVCGGGDVTAEAIVWLSLVAPATSETGDTSADKAARLSGLALAGSISPS